MTTIEELQAQLEEARRERDEYAAQVAIHRDDKILAQNARYEAEAQLARMREALDEFLLLFKSGNDIPVTRVVLGPDHYIKQMAEAALRPGGQVKAGEEAK